MTGDRVLPDFRGAAERIVESTRGADRDVAVLTLAIALAEAFNSGIEHLHIRQQQAFAIVLRKES